MIPLLIPFIFMSKQEQEDFFGSEFDNPFPEHYHPDRSFREIRTMINNLNSIPERPYKAPKDTEQHENK